MTKMMKQSAMALAFCAALQLQSALGQALVLDTTTTNYFQTFDQLGSGAPPEWSGYSAATSSSLGNPVTVTTANTSWTSTSFVIANYASTSNGGTNLLGTENAAYQATVTNRCLGTRTTGTSDTGTAFVLQIANTLGLVNFRLDLDYLLLSVQGRTNVWTVDYGVGASPTSFTVADASQNYTALSSSSTPLGVFGPTHRSISFGSALDNNAGPVWIRVVSLKASGGSGSRPTVGIDNVLLSYTNAPATAIPLMITGQPHGLTNNATTSASFTVVSAGTAPIYQWYEIDANNTTNQISDGGSPTGDGSTFSGTQSPTLTINNPFGGEAGKYFVNINNSATTGINNTNSAVVSLGVNDPAIVAQPGNMTNVLNDYDYYNATAVGSRPIQFVWYYNGNVISNAIYTGSSNTTLFVLNNIGATNLAGYYVVASNPFGSATSAVATASVAITPPVEITRWDFNAATLYTPTNPAPSIGIGSAMPTPNPNVTNFAFAQGAFFDAGDYDPSIVNDAWALNGFIATNAPNKTAGFQFNVSTVGYTNIMLTWTERHSATASKYIRVQYTTNGTDFVDGDVITFDQVLYQFYSSDLSAISGVNNNPNFGFRLVSEWESTAIGDNVTNYVGTSSAFGSGGTVRVDLMTVFGSSAGVIPIPLHITFDGTNAVLSWADSAGAFSLQSAPEVTGTYTNIPGATSPYTNGIGEARQFFRLIH